MPGKRWGAELPQASRHFNAVLSAWWAASLSHSERLTLILKRVMDRKIKALFASHHDRDDCRAPAHRSRPLERPAVRRRAE